MNKVILIVSLFLSTSLFAEQKVLSFAGSARQDSYNKKLAIEAAHLAEEMGATATYIDLKDIPMPFYDEDLESSEGMPENVKILRNLMIESDKIIISSPNYNGSFTGLLKNTLDWVSRTEDGKSSRDAFKGKKFLIISTAPGKKGGVNGLRHLREVITNIGGEVLIEEYGVPNSKTSFDKDGRLAVPELKEELMNNIQKLLQ